MNEDEPVAFLRFINSLDPQPLRKGSEVRVDGTVTVPLRKRLLVGRGAHCDVVIDSGRIAREEATLEPTEAGWLVTNLGRNQGMFVNGARALRRQLVSGDRFTLGPVLVEFVDEP